MRPTVIWYLYLGFYLAVFCTKAVCADVITPTSCSLVDVQAAINLALDGDTVRVPPGTCNWTTYIEIHKPISVIGSGIDQTTLVATGGQALFWFNSDNIFRLSGFTFKVSGTAPSKIVAINGDITGFRIDNNKFDNVDTKAFAFAPDSTGVIDHNQFVGVQSGMNIIWNGANDWESAWTAGSSDAVFIEDNLFTTSTSTTFVSCHKGCRYTFRYNTVVNGGISTHGADSSARAGGVIEAYNNDFSAPIGRFAAIFMRGGTAIVFDNTFDGYDNTVLLTNFRTCSTFGPPNDSLCNGASAIDGNAARTGDTGIHDGSGNVATLSDSSQSFTTSAFVGFHVYNTTDGSLCQVTANTTTTVTCILAGGADNDWDVSDAYKVTSGWPCADQVGRGPGGAFGSQVSEPVYAWNNTSVNPVVAGIQLAVSSCENPGLTDQIKSGQDYFDDTARPGYTKFTYPHPMTFDRNSQGRMRIDT